MKILHQFLTFGFIGIFLLANSASAHSFNLIFIAPISNQSGQSALDGFLLATTEQDSHEFETSDGHLGGLDSHVIKIDYSADKTMTENQLEKTIDQTGSLFATGLLSAAGHIDMFKRVGVVFVDPISSRFWQEQLAQPERLTTMSGGLFIDAFERAYGHPPDNYALRGYLSARVIAEVIRKSSELDRSNPSVIEQMVRTALIEPSW